MFSFRRHLFFSITLILLLALFAPVAQAMPTDIEGHWAEETIRSLVNLEILNGYPDGTFRPNQSITRAELAKILAVTYNFQPSTKATFSDLDGHWAKDYITALAANNIITGYPDGTYKPERPVTRAEATAIMTRLLKVGLEEEEYTQELTPSFSDVEQDFWAFRQIELAERLGLFPGYFQPEFQPSRTACRADTAWMINKLRKLKTVRGKALDDPADSGLLTVEPEEGETQIALIQPETIVLRNNITTTVENLRKDDNLTIIYGQNGEPAIVKAYGEVNSQDMLGKLSSMLKGKLTPDQVSSILAGDWDQVKESLKGELYNEMINIGLAPGEAESILVQDWEYLDTLGRERLSEALSEYLGITKDLSQAILDRDLDRIKEYAKIELATLALQKILQGGMTPVGT